MDKIFSDIANIAGQVSSSRLKITCMLDDVRSQKQRINNFRNQVVLSSISSSAQGLGEELYAQIGMLEKLMLQSESHLDDNHLNLSVIEKRVNEIRTKLESQSVGFDFGWLQVQQRLLEKHWENVSSIQQSLDTKFVADGLTVSEAIQTCKQRSEPIQRQLDRHQ